MEESSFIIELCRSRRFWSLHGCVGEGFRCVRGFGRGLDVKSV